MTPKIPPNLRKPLLIVAIMLMAYLAFATIIEISKNEADRTPIEKTGDTD